MASNKDTLEMRFEAAFISEALFSSEYTDTAESEFPLTIIENHRSSGIIFNGASSTQHGSNSEATLAIELIVTYYFPFTITFRNNFSGGVMSIVGPSENNPEAIVPYHNTSTKLGDGFTLTAISQQDDSGYHRVWNNYAPVARSTWQKNLSDIENTTLSSYSFFADPTDKNAVYKSGLRRKYTVDRYDQTEFDGTISPAYSKGIIEQNSDTLHANSRSINGKNYVFSFWTDDITKQNPRVESPIGNIARTAIFKYPHHTNNTAAIENTSQTKIIRTFDGTLHKVYVSINRIWYEYSTDNGAIWTIGKGGKPIGAYGAHSPAISDCSDDAVVIVYQENNDIKLATANKSAVVGDLPPYDVPVLSLVFSLQALASRS